MLVAASILPLLAFSLLQIFYSYRSERESAGQHTLEVARGLAQAVDRELQSRIIALQVLALSPTLQTGDLEAFRVLATTFLGRYAPKASIGVSDESGRLLLVAGAAAAGAANVRGNPEISAQVFRTGRPAISNLYVDASTARPEYTVDVPVLKNEKVISTLFLNPHLDSFTEIIAQQRPPEGSVVSIFDPAGVIAARIPNAERFLGQKASSLLLPLIVSQRPEGILDTTSLEGTPLLTAFSRSPQSGWSIGFGIPRAELLQPLWRDSMLALAAGGILLLLGLLVARRVAERITAPIGSLLRLSTGEVEAGAATTGLREVDEVAHVLRHSFEALRTAEEQNRLIIEGARDHAIFTTDRDGQITSWSPGAEAIFGWTAAEAQGRSASLLFTPEDHAAQVPEQELSTAASKGSANDERWHLRKDGSRVFMNGSVHPLHNSAGRNLGFLKIARDETERRRQAEALKALQEELEIRVAERTRELATANESLREVIKGREQAESRVRQLQKMEAIGQLTGGVAHDFNNMLAVIIGSLNLAQKRLPRGETNVARYIDSAIEGATRAAALTSRLLAFSRQQALAPQTVDANKLVSGMSELLHRTLGGEIKLESVLAGGLWKTQADPGQLENAILNLAINGRDAMGESGGKLTIETANCYLDEAYAKAHPETAAGQYVMMAISDTGSGMTSEIVAKAFDPFFTTKGVGKGTGLGLSQVYGFVRQSGGHIKIYSEPSHGTTVKIYLPRSSPAMEASLVKDKTQTMHQTELPRGNPREIILVVEDEDRVRQFLVEALRELGYTALHAEGAASALRTLDGHPDVALLFTDIVMPDVNGRKLADEALRRNPDLKVLFATGFTRNAVVHHGILDPGTQLISKPFTLEQLAHKVRQVLETECSEV
jgi:PAS domain S-box-containing protein